MTTPARIALSLAVNAEHVAAMTAPSVALNAHGTTSSHFGAAPQQSKHRSPDVVSGKSARAGRTTQQTPNPAATGGAVLPPAPSPIASGPPSPDVFGAALPPSPGA